MPLPHWLEERYLPEEMRAADAHAIERCGILEAELAERAGAGLARAVESLEVPGPIRVVVGPGSNGGDGIVAARMLRYAGREVDVLAPVPLDGVGGVVRQNLDRLPGPPPRRFETAALDGSGVVVDAMLGTGVSGGLDEPIRSVVSAMNDQAAPVVAADVPTGVNAATGEVVGEAVHATVTATNHAAKIGTCVAPGVDHAGTVRVTDIGIPPGSPPAEAAGAIRPAVLTEVEEHGEVEIIGADTGSLALAAGAALRGGANSAVVTVPQADQAALTLAVPEATVQTGEWSPSAGSTSVVCIPHTAEASARRFDTRPVLDTSAGLVISVAALRGIDEDDAVEGLRHRRSATVLVGDAHAADDLLPSGSRPPLVTARELATRSHSTVVLTGRVGLAVAPTGPVAVVPRAVDGTERPGCGPVLVGLVSALLAGPTDPLAAAAASLLAHADAISRAAQSRGAARLLGSDALDRLPTVLTTLSESAEPGTRGDGRR